MLDDITTYPLGKKWRKFRPFLNHSEVRRIENLAMRALRPEYVAGRHIPREAGWLLDKSWPRSRTGVRAYQCFGYCHAIAPVIATLARLAEPQYVWELIPATAHTVVVGSKADYSSDNILLIDVNNYDGGDASILKQFNDQVLNCPDTRDEDNVVADFDWYISHRLGPHFQRAHPIRSPLNDWEPEEGAWEHYHKGGSNA